MRHGYTVAWVGWQPDVPQRGRAHGARRRRRARGVDRIRAVRVPAEHAGRRAADGRPLSRAAADRRRLDDPARGSPCATRGAPSAWASRARAVAASPIPPTSPSTAASCPGGIYDLVYRARTPPVGRPQLLAVRDTGRGLRWGSAAAGNPCAGSVERAYVFGVSQSGRFLRHLLYLGLDEDEQGRLVFDAIVPHVAGARRGEFNMRFGQPSLNAQESVGSLFPFTDATQMDPVTGERVACSPGRRRGRRPARIMSINTSAEYWRGDGSLVHTDVEATAGRGAGRRRPASISSPGSQHTPGALPPPPADPNTGSRGLHTSTSWTTPRCCGRRSSTWTAGCVRACEPPPSAVPRMADGTAVPGGRSPRKSFAAIPGVRFPDRLARPARLDFGPEMAARGIPDAAAALGAPFPTLVLGRGRGRQRGRRHPAGRGGGVRWPRSPAGTCVTPSRARRAISCR